MLGDDQIKHIVARFLSWKLPENFAPDGGISFNRYGNIGTEHQYTNKPVGTNLLDYTQAEAMVRHLLEGMPSAVSESADLPFKRGDRIRKLKGHDFGGGFAEVVACYRNKAGAWRVVAEHPEGWQFIFEPKQIALADIDEAV